MVCGWLTLNQSRLQNGDSYECQEPKEGHSCSWLALWEWAPASLQNSSGLHLDLACQVITSVVDWHRLWDLEKLASTGPTT